MNEHIVRLSDILEQIEQLNKMIAFHRDQSKEESMRRQYEEMRESFLQELQNILAEFKLKANIQVIEA